MDEQLGVRRLITRPDNKSHWQTEELVCPCCGRTTRVEFEQDDGKGDHYTLTHCLNAACTGYYMTRKVAAFFETYGQHELKSDQ